jgi:hypothetical protein
MFLPENTTFAAECLLPWSDLIKKSGWVLGAPLVTQSKRWGQILRVDFKIPGEDLSPLVNRLICWRTPAGNLQLNVAIGQRVPPLGKASSFRLTRRLVAPPGNFPTMHQAARNVAEVRPTGAVAAARL